MLPNVKHRHFRLAVILFVMVGLLFVTSVPLHAAASPRALGQEESASQTGAAGATADDPRACIDPKMALHIAATLASLLPMPGYADAADAAAFFLNIALKGCPPDFTPPPDIFVPQPSDGCVHHMVLSVPSDYQSIIELERKIADQVLGAPQALLSDVLRDEIIAKRDSKWGRFGENAYGTYSNIYGMALPITLSDYASPYWGDIGKPDIFHYNSDVLIELGLPGERISPNEIEVPVGNHTLVWTANTLVSPSDYIPIFLATSAMRYYKAYQAQATKRFAIDGTKKELRDQIAKVLKEGDLFFAKQVAEEIALRAAKKAQVGGSKLLYKNSYYFIPGNLSGASTTALQKLTIVDPNPPTVTGPQSVVVEALDPGGVQSARNINDLMAAIQISDDCDLDPTLTYSTPQFWPLLVDSNGNPQPSAEITWRGSDDGAASAAGGVNTTEFVQQITVQDTLSPILVAPPPVMMYAETGETIEIPLGSPQVFDVADLRPTIDYDAPNTTQGAQWPVFGRGVHYVTWTATDASGNSAEPQQQLVNVKAPGSNTTPTAAGQTGGNAVQAITDEPVRITVRGNDPDVDGNNLRDPLWFRIDQPPANGFFIAPLYPYFINDYRLTARYSPTIAAREGEEFAWQVAQSREAMSIYIEDLCSEPGQINRTDLPIDFINFSLSASEKHMAVDDQGYTYIYDRVYTSCNRGGSTTVEPVLEQRVSVWDQQGQFVGQTLRVSMKDIKFNVGRGTLIETDSDGPSGRSYIGILGLQPENADDPVVEIRGYPLENSVNAVVVNDDGDTRRPIFERAGSAAFDTTNNILYVIGDPQYREHGMAAYKPAPCNIKVVEDPEACLDFLGVQIYSFPIVTNTRWEDFPGLGLDAMHLETVSHIALDSQGAVYVAAQATEAHYTDRIYKFAPPTIHPDGSITLGEFIGWMGKCTGGSNCNFIEQRSIGFSCTDATCTIGDETTGSGPGQFGGISAIAVDPKDVLYVADGANARVQRFTTSGLFAGEAKSQSECDNCGGFILGDFGRPSNISVNSNNFYVLDTQTDLVHVFETSVIHNIDDASAWIEYQSNSNYVGSDAFTFRATDGFHDADGNLVESDPATVAINVARNFRPPIAEDLGTSTPEDTPVDITLPGRDLDGDLDALTYEITTPPQHGTLSGTPPNVTYTPVEDFADEDSFQYTVNDGRDTSAPGVVTVLVIPANDTPELVPEATTLQVGLGYPATINATVLDPDVDDLLSVFISWGDGSSEATSSANYTGIDQTTSIAPLVDGESQLLAYHTYAAAGSYTVNIEVTDAAGTQDTAQVQVNMGPLPDLAVLRDAQPTIPTNRQQASYELTVHNQRSPSGDGASATDVRISEVLTGSATYGAAIASSGDCQVDAKHFECTLGSLGPDQEAKVTVQLQVAGVGAGAVIALDATATSSTPDALPENNRDLLDLAIVPVGDFYVDSLRDGVDATPGDGTCATSFGDCTVRAAIMEANALGGAQKIVLGRGVFVLEGEGAATAEVAAGHALDPATGDLDIDSDITLVGIGAQLTTIHANGIDRVMDIHSGVVQIEDLALAGGNAGTNANGGGILNDGGEVLLQRVSVDGGYAVNGGGIMNAGGDLRIVQSSIVDNRASSSGGGIMNEATLTLENSTLSGNQATTGGGLADAGDKATLLYVTVSGNAATSAGGGINNGGGDMRIENTLLAGNDAPTGPDCAPGIASGGHNVIGSLANCNVSGSSEGNVTNVTPRIDQLSVNAAGTYSYPLLQGSPALDRATCVRPNDQGGMLREDERCDTGAFEADAFLSALYLPLLDR